MKWEGTPSFSSFRMSAPSSFRTSGQLLLINVVRILRRRNEVLLGYMCLSTLPPSAIDKMCCPVLVNSVTNLYQKLNFADSVNKRWWLHAASSGSEGGEEGDPVLLLETGNAAWFGRGRHAEIACRCVFIHKTTNTITNCKFGSYFRSRVSLKSHNSS